MGGDQGSWPTDAEVCADIEILLRNEPSGKFDAAMRLASRRSSKPVAPQRWSLYEQHFLRTLREDAVQHSRTTEDELILRTISALFIALQSIRDIPRDQWVKVVQRKLNDLVTVDLLGQDWRRILTNSKAPDCESAIPQPDQAHDVYDECHKAAELQVMKIVAQTDIVGAELSLLIDYASGLTSAELGDRYGLKPGTVRVRVNRLLGLLRKAAM